MNEVISKLKSGKYTLAVKSSEKIIPGAYTEKVCVKDSRVLENRVLIVDVEGKPSTTEEIAWYFEFPLYEKCVDITTKPQSFGLFFHKQFVQDVRQRPEVYIQDMKAIKENFIY